MIATPDENWVINKANEYLESLGMHGFCVKSTRYHKKQSPAEVLRNHSDLLADLDLSELSVVEEFCRSGWSVTYECADPGTDPAPNAPTVYVYDDGDLSHVLPI
jgi:hypothetical protein